MPDTLMTALRAARKAKDLTQTDLGKKLRSGKESSEAACFQLVSRFERGITIPDVRTTRALEKVLKVPLVDCVKEAVIQRWETV